MIATKSYTLFILIALVLYCLVLTPFISYMKTKPIEEKLGYFPTSNVLKYVSADHKELIGALLVMRTIIYYGGLIEQQQNTVIVQPPDFQGMSRILHGAVQLDPYNMDAYYFAQSFLTWEAKQYELATNLMVYGMRYRSWDWMLPYFAGFNSAYFLKDYTKAAVYYKQVGNLTGNDVSISLAGRYMQESGQTELAILYLSEMEKNERIPAVKKKYQIRLKAFQEVRRIELARDKYLHSEGKLPESIEFLQNMGLLKPFPVDPYGGHFYFESDGKVSTTSKFAFASVEK